MSTGIREIEFEFREAGSGEFRPAGNVVQVLTDYLKRNDIDQAAALLAASGEEIGDLLIEESRSGASRELWRRLVNLFSEARDMGRAARCAAMAGDHDAAARFLEAAYDWAGAARAYESAKDFAKAALMYERSQEFEKAAALYVETGEFLKAAESFAKFRSYPQAGRYYLKAGRVDQAVEVLQKAGPEDAGYVESSALLGRIFEKLGNIDMAAARYVDVVRRRPIDEATIDIHHRLATILASRGHRDKAVRLWNGVLRIFPSHSGAMAGMREMGSAASPRPAKDEPPPLVLPGGPTNPPPETVSDNRMSLPVDEPPGGHASVVAVRVDFEILRKLPIFSELSLDELRMMHNIAGRVTCKPGEVLIEQGQPGKNLFVIASGRVKVEALAPGKEPKLLATLGKGATIGEMSLADASPTSARCTAIEEVHAFKFPVDQLGAYMASDPRVGAKILSVLSRILSIRLREANRALSV